MSEIIDLEETKKKLVDRLRESGWSNLLKTFMLSTDFDKILEFLVKEKDEGRRFTPALKTMFRAFEKCPYDKLRVVICLQDPYPQLLKGIPIADGLATSCSVTGILQPSLDYIFREIYKTTYSGKKGEIIPSKDPDLKRWANQGILLANTALSVEVNKPGTHQAIWRPFTSFWLDMLNNQNQGLIFVFLGKKAQELESLIDDDRHFKLMASHPASAAYNNLAEWNSGNLFPEINKLMWDNYKEKINW